MDPRTIGHTVTSPEDTMEQLKTLFKNQNYFNVVIKNYSKCNQLNRIKSNYLKKKLLL